ncbi:MAG: hypothetical protein KZQ92_06745 [Candidatus Thiodiazotropha sp. (ex Lucinoma borealis)]|nr:hypothetical protein [Candidatus Thiodiazotropha sp. (ex Lucinoma borealis)]
MTRMEEILELLVEKYLDDWWLNDLKIVIKNEEDFLLDQLNIYSNALEVLDIESWVVIREKVVIAFKQNTKRRGKQQFFNLLNEVLAYEYLIEANYQSVTLLRENGIEKTPDIKFFKNETECYCEVKTIGNSEEELDRTENMESFNDSTYSKLGDGFFKKLSSTLDFAIDQLYSDTPHNIIYVIVKFDDFVGPYYETYKQQVSEFLIAMYPNTQVLIRAGLENRFIHHHMLTAATQNQ